MGLSKVKIFPVGDMGRIAADHIPILQRRVQGGIDYRGRKFKRYTDKYADIKGRRFTSEITGKKYKYPKARITSTKVSPPDLTLTGFMLMGLERREYKHDYYKIGWRGEDAEKVEGNKANGRNIIDGVPDKEYKFIVKRLEKSVGKELNKLKNVKITIGN